MMKLIRRIFGKEVIAPLDTYGAVYWKDTPLGKYIINNLEDEFTLGNDVPIDGSRFTAVASDGMLYFNDNAKELEEIIPRIIRWKPQDKLNNLLDYADEN